MSRTRPKYDSKPTQDLGPYRPCSRKNQQHIPHTLPEWLARQSARHFGG